MRPRPFSPARQTSQGSTTRRLFGVDVVASTKDEAVSRVAAAIERRERLHIGVVNAAKLVNMNRDPMLHSDVMSSDVIYADGMGAVWASRILGQPLPERIAGIDLMLGILERGSATGWRIYCLGAETQVLERAVSRMKALYPGIQIVGHQHGYFEFDEEALVAQRIADAHADVLFVAMTSPKKERFLARWADRLEVPVFHGVGGSFDVLAGKVNRAPQAWQRFGLEWLYRVKQEPRRLWRRYLVTNTLFCVMVAAEVWRGRGRRMERAPKC